MSRGMFAIVMAIVMAIVIAIVMAIAISLSFAHKRERDRDAGGFLWKVENGGNEAAG